MTFTVIVVCVAGFSACPLKGEYRQAIEATSVQHCVETARTAMTSFGVDPANFKIRCQK